MKAGKRFDRALLRVALLLARASMLARGVLAAKGGFGAVSAELDALRSDRDRWREEALILRARLERLEPRKRPWYAAGARFAILWHRAFYGLSLEETAKAFVVTPTTVARWIMELKRKATPLVRPPAPLNKLPDFIREVVHRLKAENVNFGARKIAGFLVQLGLKGSRPSVQRILREKPPKPRRSRAKAEPEGRPLTADGPNQVWLIDLTKIDLFCMFAIRIAAVIDLHSRKILAIECWREEPTGSDVRRLVARAIRDHGKPDHIVTDHGTQFTSKLFTRFLVRRGIRRRFGAVASSQSVAVMERFWLTLKIECRDGLRPWRVLEVIRANAKRYVEWYNRHRPHGGLDGLTPDEAHHGRKRRRRHARTEGTIVLSFHEGDRSLPIYRFRRAA